MGEDNRLCKVRLALINDLEDLAQGKLAGTESSNSDEVISLHIYYYLNIKKIKPKLSIQLD